MNKAAGAASLLTRWPLGGEQYEQIAYVFYRLFWLAKPA